MMHSLHRTIPFIAFAALVTVQPAGAQERDDSTSSAGAVVSLLGLGGNFVGFGAGDDDPSHPNAWNCAGGCAAFGARGFAIAPFGAAVSSKRAALHDGSVANVRSVPSPTDRADLSDYGWSRRVGTDGAPLAPVVPTPIEPTSAVDAVDSADESARPLAPRVPDGAGSAPSWAPPGSSPVASPAAWTTDLVESAAGDGDSGSADRATPPGQRTVPNQAITAFAEAFDAAPLVTTVPEPSTVVLLAAGLSSLLFLRRRSARGR